MVFFVSDWGKKRESERGGEEFIMSKLSHQGLLGIARAEK